MKKVDQEPVSDLLLLLLLVLVQTLVLLLLLLLLLPLGLVSTHDLPHLYTVFYKKWRESMVSHMIYLVLST